MRRALVLLFVLASVALAWALVDKLSVAGSDPDGSAERPPAPVAVEPVERGPITLRRTFSGALEPAAQLVLAPKISGRIDRLLVDLGDTVQRGQVVARLDDAELVQAVNEAEAELAVARATLTAAQSALEISERGLKRAEALRTEGVASESQLDAARTDQVTARAEVDLAAAGIPRASASLEAARIRLGYARVAADWNEGDDHRVVGERFVDEGANVGQNAALLSILELDPLLAVIQAPERDYPRISVGQAAVLTTDAYPGRTFEAHVARIAPVFRRSTRQARIELSVANEDSFLKPGMFVRATLALESVPEATVVPYEALTQRGDETGVFVVDAAGERASWRPVEPGIREGDRIEVLGPGVTGRVVVLGQELCDDGGPVTIPDSRSTRAEAAEAVPHAP